jgi:hypothetical protein
VKRTPKLHVQNASVIDPLACARAFLSLSLPILVVIYYSWRLGFSGHVNFPDIKFVLPTNPGKWGFLFSSQSTS